MASMLKELEKLQEKTIDREIRYTAYLVAGIITGINPTIESVSIKSTNGSQITKYADKIFASLGPTCESNLSYREAADTLRVAIKESPRWQWVLPYMNVEVKSSKYFTCTIYADEELEEVLRRLGVTLGKYSYDLLGFLDSNFNDDTYECLRQLNDVYCE